MRKRGALGVRKHGQHHPEPLRPDPRQGLHRPLPRFRAGLQHQPLRLERPVSVGFPNFTVDVSGNASVTLKTDMSKIEGDKGASINVHYASDPSVVPICAPVNLVKS